MPKRAREVIDLTLDEEDDSRPHSVDGYLVLFVVLSSKLLSFHELKVVSKVHRSLQKQCFRWMRIVYTKDMTKKHLELMPRSLCTLLENSSVPVAHGIITEKMKKRDYCGLLTQRDSITTEEIHHPLTLLVDSYNFAFVLRIKYTKVPHRPTMHAFLSYMQDVTPVIGCKEPLCDKMWDRYQETNDVQDEDLSEWTKLVPDWDTKYALNFDEAKSTSDSIVQWVYSYKSSHHTILETGRMPVCGYNMGLWDSCVCQPTVQFKELLKYKKSFFEFSPSSLQFSRLVPIHKGIIVALVD